MWCWSNPLSYLFFCIKYTTHSLSTSVISIHIGIMANLHIKYAEQTIFKPSHLWQKIFWCLTAHPVKMRFPLYKFNDHRFPARNPKKTIRVYHISHFHADPNYHFVRYKSHYIIISPSSYLLNTCPIFRPVFFSAPSLDPGVSPRNAVVSRPDLREAPVKRPRPGLRRNKWWGKTVKHCLGLLLFIINNQKIEPGMICSCLLLALLNCQLQAGHAEVAENIVGVHLFSCWVPRGRKNNWTNWRGEAIRCADSS